jgi:hypothetical protein
MIRQIMKNLRREKAPQIIVVERGGNNSDLIDVFMLLKQMDKIAA